MKKLLSLLLFAALTLSLFACGAPKKDENTEKTDTADTAVQTTAISDTDTATAEDTTEAPAETEDNEPYAPGTVSENTYTGNYFGFGCKFGDDWEVSGHAPDENYSNDMDKEVIYELDASNSENTEFVRIVVKNMGAPATPLNEKSYLHEQSDSFKESLEGSGAENVSVEILPVEFADNFHYAFRASGEVNGESMEEYVIAVQRGTYFANVIIGTLDSNTDELISAFFAVE